MRSVPPVAAGAGSVVASGAAVGASATVGASAAAVGALVGASAAGALVGAAAAGAAVGAAAGAVPPPPQATRIGTISVSSVANATLLHPLSFIGMFFLSQTSI